MVENNKSIEPRISALEVGLQAVVRDLQIVAKDISQTNTNISHLADKVNDYVTKTAESKQANWGTLAAWAAALFGIILYHNTLVLKPYDDFMDVQHSINKDTAQELHKHVELPFHPVLGERLSRFEKEVDVKDEILLQKIKNLDNKIFFLGKQIAFDLPTHQQDVDMLREELHELNQAILQSSKASN